MKVTFLTHQRPEILKEALVSFIQYLKNSGKPADITVLDDSIDPAAVAANRELAAGLTGTFSGSLRCFGWAERELLADRLCPGSPEPALDFALSLPGAGVRGHSGANRNTGLLLYTGQKILSLDDDTLFCFRRLRDGRAFHENSGDIPLLLPLGSRKRLERLTVPTDWDPDVLQEILGSPPHTGDYTGPVKLAMSGIYGGRWYTNPHAYCAVPPRTANKIWQGKKEYVAARQDPWALMVQPEVSFSGAPFLVSTCFGYDSSEPVPPFFPGIRSSDSLWAWMLRAMYPESPICHLPLAIEHERSIKQPFEEDDFSRIVPGASEIIVKLLDFLRQGVPGSPEAPGMLSALGSGLSRFAAEPVQRRREILSELYLASLGRRIGAFHERLEAGGGRPRFFGEDLKRHIDLLHNEALDSRPWLPKEFRLKDDIAGEEAFRRYLDSCGELLCAWPEIWQRAEALCKSGDQIL
ncbi:hypothetical protein [Marispirochaeta sp.]|uniref:hypothetical protein n=1 Tax=Marispirochaeta sp. TaxID=2038653 RepID=UPI0029C7EAB1|nr:hypothetical protein [Marispirochaeta sp.]